MRMHRTNRLHLLSLTGKALACVLLTALFCVVPFATGQPGTAAKPQPIVLDHVVAVVNNYAILASDLDEEVRLSILDPDQAGHGLLSRQKALEQLIARTLIQQQIRQEEERARPQ